MKPSSPVKGGHQEQALNVTSVYHFNFSSVSTTAPLSTPGQDEKVHIETTDPESEKLK